jgi:hypothetical protein
MCYERAELPSFEFRKSAEILLLEIYETAAQNRERIIVNIRKFSCPHRSAQPGPPAFTFISIN